MAPFLILLGLVLAAASLATSGVGFRVEKRATGELAAAAATLIALTLCMVVFGRGLDQPALLTGLGIGAALSVIAVLLNCYGAPGPLSLSIGCAASGLILLMPTTHLDQLCLAVVVSSGTVAALSRTKTSAFVAVLLSAVCFTHLLGHGRGATGVGDQVAPVALSALTLAALVGVAIKPLRNHLSLWPLFVALAGFGALFGISRIALPEMADWFGLLLAPVVVIVIYWLQRGESEPRFALVLSTVMWIGLATVAFGAERSVGLSIALLLTVGMLALLDCQKALLSAGPLLGLVLHRVFRAEQPGVGGVIDIGQHYALIGFTLAALLPLLPFEWSKLRPTLRDGAITLGHILWVMTCFAVPVLIALFLSPKGLLGFVTGLGFCGFFACMEPLADLSPLALGSAVGAIAIVEYGSVEKFTNLTRDEKVHWFIICGVAFALIAALLAGLSFAPRKVLAATEAI